MPPYNDAMDYTGPPRAIGGPVIDSFHAKHNLGGARLHQRPAADIPSSSSSGSWQAFPNSHPRNRQQQMNSNASIVSGSVHPHIRELVERQQQQRHQQTGQQHPHHLQQHREHERREREKEMRHRGVLASNESVVRGLTMEHVVNHQYGEGAYVDDHTIKTLKSHRPPGYNPNPDLGSPLGSPMHGAASLQRNPLDGEDYVIEGTFQNKGCVCQTADDVGYLFGCGTKPQDEVVYVYNTQPEQPPPPPTARADDRNLFYHRGPEDNASIHDVLFQIDKEYQAMQAHGEFLRDPPPGASPRASGPPRGHYNVVHDDDEYTKGGCSLSSIMDLLLPGRRAKQRRKNGVFDPFCSSPRRRRARNVSSSDSVGSFDKARNVMKNASDSVVELQTQLKAMVHERARRQVSPPKEAPADETRQEPTPPASPKKEEVAKEREVESLKKEQASLDQARRMLEVELAAHRQNVAAMNQQMAGGMGVAGVGGMAVSPTAMSVQHAPMMLSPLSAPTPVSAHMVGVQPMVNAINSGVWPQQPVPGMANMQQSALHMMQGTQVSPPPQAHDAHTVAQSTLASRRPPMEVSTSHVPHDATSVMGKSMMSHTIGNTIFSGMNEGKFIDNVGGAYALRSNGGPRTPSQARSPPSRRQQRTPSSGRSVRSNTAKLHDLQVKNALIQQDIASMKECMNGGSVSPKKGRPFPRTSPESPIARAMRRSDEARSVRDGGASVASRSLYEGHRQGRYGQRRSRQGGRASGRR